VPLGSDDFPIDVDEYIPDDGFDHDKGTTSCPCNPETYAIPGLGSGIIHKRMLTDAQITDWMKKDPEELK